MWWCSLSLLSHSPLAYAREAARRFWWLHPSEGHTPSD
ncbi:unnamed protein product [Spirodela intermedia]|uniref:Uncharacterized protein n=1 Tax=Spirodela intermedia TaxID=51605 RepID=A0A7I8KC95_SPIIN|nr:unnamed protein product [Spirodela intermedia]